MKRLEIRNPQSAIRNRRGFTLVEILVAMGVFVILGVALVGMMAAAMDAWRRGEAGRQVNEKLQTLKRQLSDDLAAAVLDPPPAPDFHFALDTLYDLSATPGDPNAILDTARSTITQFTRDESDGRLLTYFAPTTRPGSATVVLRIRVPFIIGAALLQARTDLLEPNSAARVVVARNDPTAPPPLDQEPPADGDPAWKVLADLPIVRDGAPNAGIGGGETDVSEALKGGNIVFIKAVLTNQSADTDAAQFLRSDRMRAGGRPVLILDCYRDDKALAQHPRPTFAAWFKDGAQIVTFTRTLPPEIEQAAAKTTGSANSPEYLNHADDDQDGAIDEDHRPVVGRAQVLYVFQPYHSSLGKPGLGVVRRAFEAPLRRPSGTSQPDLLTIPNIVSLVGDIPSHDFIPNVLHLGMSFWGADTTTWEDRPDLEPGYGTKYTAETRPRPASTEWLSSRYLPEQVQVTAVLEPDRGKRTQTALAGGIAADFPTADPGRLAVLSTLGFDNVVRPSAAFCRDPRHFIKINSEWVFYGHVASPTEFAIPRQGSDGLAARGCRGTRRVAHPPGAEVYRGTVSVFTVAIPAYHHWQR